MLKWKVQEHLRYHRYCENDNNFKVKVIKHADDSNCAITRKFCHETACMSLEGKKGLLIR